ncbi:MAG: LUD domain-containing protein [Chloroflexi bacterium]|nr:LUD domain-containing protein [Chloroflexota bacterium]
MSARDEILNKLRSRSRQPDTHPPAWRSRRHFDDLAERFAESLGKSKGEVIRAGSLDEAFEQLDQTLLALGARCVVANDEPPLSQIDLAARWPGMQWHIVGRTPGDLRGFCATADAGVSSVVAALAETGSVVVTSGPGKSRLATLLPPVHIALVPESCLTADLYTFTAARQGPPPAMQTLISGPSKTADIEQTMAVGVHGPKRFIVILYRD